MTTAKRRVRKHCYACGQRNGQVRDVEGKQLCTNCFPERHEDDSAEPVEQAAFESEDGKQ